MKKVLIGTAVLLFAGSVLAVESTALSVNEKAKWDADAVVTFRYTDLPGTASNTTYTITNVLNIASGQVCTLQAFVLDDLFISQAHTNGGTVGVRDIWTNGWTLTVTDAGGTNNILPSTQIHSESAYITCRIPMTNYSQTVLTALTQVDTCTVAVTTGTLSVVVQPAGNKYYNAVNYVSCTFTPGVAFQQAPSKLTKGKFRLFFRTKRNNE